MASAGASDTRAATTGLGERLRPYRTVLASRARSQRAYRTSFVLDLGGSALIGLVELAEVAAALLHSPRLVILDEPTIGLDVLSKQRLREFLVGERRRHATTLLLATHDMGDVERLCGRILVIDHGRLAYDGDLPGLSRTVGAERVLVVDLAEALPDLTGLDDARHLSPEAGGLRQRLAFDAEQTTAAKVLAAVSNKAEVLDLTVEEPDIEDVVRRLYAATRQPAT